MTVTAYVCISITGELLRVIESANVIFFFVAFYEYQRLCESHKSGCYVFRLARDCNLRLLFDCK